MRRTRTIRGGYSLIELMLAMGIMSVGLMMIGTTLPTGILNSDEANLKTNSTIICDNAQTILRNELRHTVLKNWFNRKFVQHPQLVTTGQSQFLELSQGRNYLMDDDDGNSHGFKKNGIPTEVGLNYVDRFYPHPTGSSTGGTDYSAVWTNNAFWYLTSDLTPCGFNPSTISTWQPTTRYAWLVLARPVLPTGFVLGTTPIPNDYEFIVVPVRRHMAEDPLVEITFWRGLINGAGQFGFGVTLDGAKISSSTGTNYAPKGTLIIALQDVGTNPCYGWAIDDSGNVYTQSGARIVWPAMTIACAVVDLNLNDLSIKTPNALGVARFRMSLQP